MKRLFCRTCKKRGSLGWTCRSCARQCCAHYCKYKVGKTAYCGCADKPKR